MNIQLSAVAAKAERRSRMALNRLKRRSRASSFPFASGDTFRAIADIVIESRQDLFRAQQILIQEPHSAFVVFADPVTAPAVLSELGQRFGHRVVLLVHNGDRVPSSQIAEHSSHFAQIFTVNWMLDVTNVRPLPIGLENSWRGINGRMSLFEDCRPDNRRLLLSRQRDINILVAFNDETNSPVRKRARQCFTEAPGSMTLSGYTRPERYHQLLRRSLFTVSPPGNGLDCHRTWEAIYAGSVPIVLRSAWSFADRQLPVLVVDDWEQALERISMGPQEVYRQLCAHEPHDAYVMPYLHEIEVALRSINTLDR